MRDFLPRSEFCSINFAVLVHGIHLMQGVAKMVSAYNPREVLVVQLYRGRVVHILHPSTEVNALGLGFCSIGVSGENQDVFLTVF